MRYFLLLALFGAQWAFAQPKPIVAVEYYFDNFDPGYGDAIAVAVPQPSEDLHLSFDAPTSNLTPGLHQFDVRVKRDSIWSDTHRRLFYVNQLSVQTEDTVEVAQAEYYFGTNDPGYGNATPLTVPSPGTQVTFADDIDISNLQPGFHDFSMRVRAEDGMWSGTHTRFFYLPDTVSRHRLTRIDYEIRQGSSVLGTGSVPISPEQYTVELTFDATTGSLASGSYDLCAVAVDAAGRQSEAVCRPFEVQTQTGVVDEVSTGLRAYPNPTTGPLILEASRAYLMSYRLSGVQGRVLLQGQLPPNSLTGELDLSHLPAGQYFLAVEQPGRVVVLPVLKR